jgi:hypothetical protein
MQDHGVGSGLTTRDGVRLTHGYGVCAQDHVVGGVLLTKQDTFLTRAEYTQLVYAACAPTRRGVRNSVAMPFLPPVIMKPEPLWTGKQVGSFWCLHYMYYPDESYLIFHCMSVYVYICSP